MIGALRQAVDAFADLAFPRSCVACAGLAEHPSYPHFCGRCASQLNFVAGPACTTCGHPFFGQVEGERICPHCDGLSAEFNHGRTAVLCRGPARSLVHELKYHRGVFLGADVEAIFRASPEVLTLVKDSILVPVPLHLRKLRQRGYNQSVLIAEALRRAVEGRAKICSLLRRTSDTASQTGFDRRARIANLKNAFALRRDTIINASHHYVLVDDVFTTGSTLNGCARVLRHAGAVNLDVVTFGHG